MKNSILYILAIIALSFQTSIAQDNPKTIWLDPAKSNFNVIDNQGWPGDKLSAYDRLPEKTKSTVRASVWNLSRHSAGLKIRFRSNSDNIIVRYHVDGNMEMSHMPATGVSGVDLYAKNSNGDWLWNRGKYSFGDTVKYVFSGINPKDTYHDYGREYQLYLPLYNSVEWLEIGVPDDSKFEFLPIRLEKPIVVYGTSIAHGACASRPGMAWASILERKMDRPLINLGFSGNGRLEEEVIDLITEVDAKIYVLDCLPNLTPNDNRTLIDVHELIISAVNQLKSKRPKTPILLVEHDGYSDASLNEHRNKIVTGLNKTMKKAFAELKASGIENIYTLTKEELGLGYEDFVDGTHPSDLGMMKYANNYEMALREILNEPVGKSSTTNPVTQMREPNNYDWEERHYKLLEMNKSNPPDICFFGNSITHFWGGQPDGPRKIGEESWENTFEDVNVRNFGYGWDRVENVLWRVYHDELDGFEAKQIIMKIGTNNLHLNTNEEIIDGLELLIKAMKDRQPRSKILIVGLLPRRDNEERVSKFNLSVARLTGKLNVSYADIGKLMLLKDGKIDESLFSDGLHPNEKGYQLIGPELRKYLVK